MGLGDIGQGIKTGLIDNKPMLLLIALNLINQKQTGYNDFITGLFDAFPDGKLAHYRDLVVFSTGINPHGFDWRAQSNIPHHALLDLVERIFKAIPLTITSVQAKSLSEMKQIAISWHDKRSPGIPTDQHVVIASLDLLSLGQSKDIAIGPVWYRALSLNRKITVSNNIFAWLTNKITNCCWNTAIRQKPDCPFGGPRHFLFPFSLPRLRVGISTSLAPAIQTVRAICMFVELSLRFLNKALTTNLHSDPLKSILPTASSLAYHGATETIGSDLIISYLRIAGYSLPLRRGKSNYSTNIQSM